MWLLRTRHLRSDESVTARRVAEWGMAARLGAQTMLWLALALLMARPVAGQGANGPGVVVVVSQDNPVTTLSLPELRDILSGQRTHWSSGRPVTLILMPSPGTPERRIVLGSVLSMDEAAYRKHWVGRVFRAESASAPTVGESPDVICRAVARIRGAIGLVSAPTPDVRVVRINGMLPSDAAYPLR